MKKSNIFKIHYLMMLFLAVMAGACSDNEFTPTPEGVPLELTLGIESYAGTRLAELNNPEDMTIEKDGLKNVGIYVYYQEDYDNNDLSKPYVRNQEFTIVNGNQLQAVEGDKQIYIYDKMVVVAFYPYNSDPTLPNFNTKKDEAWYPVTRREYNQFYIPYRAQVSVNPTTAFNTKLVFRPKHTYKLELTLVNKIEKELPDSTKSMILPLVDPVNPDNNPDGTREKWYDKVVVYDNDNANSGSYAHQYVTYIWTAPNSLLDAQEQITDPVGWDNIYEGNDKWNKIQQGTILFQCEDFTLIASEDVMADEQRVYRYGYNMTTGKVFIPTASKLINDKESLKGIEYKPGEYYQVCDIELGEWTPINLINTQYDGGGNKLTNMKVNTTAPNAGLFGNVKGNSIVADILLESPNINVEADNARVGGIIGNMNTEISEDEYAKIEAGLPPDMSDVVKEELMKEIRTSKNTTSKLAGSKVTDPVITVKGKDPIVGGAVGSAGKDGSNNANAEIWDTGVIGGTLSVNPDDPDNNGKAKVGGFIGSLNKGTIDSGITTILPGDIAAKDKNGKDIATGFGNITPNKGTVTKGYSQFLTDKDSNGVKDLTYSWPGFDVYDGHFPVLVTGWFSGSGATSFWYSNGSAPDNYPVLQWERK